VTLRLTAGLELSAPAENRLPLLWIAVVHVRVPCSLAASTGVHSPDEVFKYLLAGADVAGLPARDVSRCRLRENRHIVQ
jgi:dihydroorotate dehydrogenase (fumarate)